MIDFSALTLGPCLSAFGRPIWVLPLASQPGQPGYWARGDFRIRNVDIPTMDGQILSEQTLTMGVRLADFAVPAIGKDGAPRDQVYVPACLGRPAAGPFWIDDTDDDVQGHSVWTLKIARADPRNVPPEGAVPYGF